MQQRTRTCTSGRERKAVEEDKRGEEEGGTGEDEKQERSVVVLKSQGKPPESELKQSEPGTEPAT